LLNTLVAYTGTYRLEGDEWITNVDVAWNPEWVGTEQKRFFKRGVTVCRSSQRGEFIPTGQNGDDAQDSHIRKSKIEMATQGPLPCSRGEDEGEGSGPKES